MGGETDEARSEPVRGIWRAWREGISSRLALKLIVYLTLIVVVVQGMAALLTLNLHERRLLEQMVVSADQLSGTIAHGTWQAMLADRRQDAYLMMRDIARQPGIEQIRIFNKEGRVMFSTGDGTGALVDKNAEACDLCHAAEQPLVRVDVPSRARTFRRPGGDRVLGMVMPIYNEPACSEAACHAHPEAIQVLGVLDLDMSLRHVDASMSRARWGALGVTLLTIVLAAALIVVFVRRFVGRPIDKLIEATHAISAMELDRPIGVQGRDEVGDLAHHFDLMRFRLKQALEELNRFAQGLELKVAERTEQLQEAQQSLIRQDRLASLGRLSASMAHEINNPIAGVHNLTMLMDRLLKEDGIPHDRVEEFREYIRQAERETTRVGRIVADLLTFARQSTPRRAPTDFNAAVRDTLTLIAYRLTQARCWARMDLDGSLPPVSCDRTQLMQVVMNLVINAAEASPTGGRIDVRTVAENGRVILEVQDAGTGIPEDAQARIFDPFFTTKEDGKGVGLGLAVVYGIIEAHGGEIDVRSAPGAGAVFRVRLPIQPDASAAPTGAGASPGVARTSARAG